MLSALELMVNQVLSLAPSSQKNLALLAGKTLKISVREIPGYLFCQFHATHIRLFNKLPTNTSVQITGSASDLLILAIKKDSSALDKLNLEIYGDMAVALHIQKLMLSLDIDWEEQLSVFTGDIFSRKIAVIARNIQSYKQDILPKILSMTTEYLQEEVRFFPTQSAVRNFMNEVDDLRLSADRIEANINLLLGTSRHEIY